MTTELKKKILIIEDDVFLGDVLVEKLKTENFDVVLSRDGRDGFGKISTFKPDIILLDIILPSMNGYEILEAKIAEPSIKDIPVIIISNSGQPVEISRVIALGVKDYLIKAQFDPAEVIAKVKSQLLSMGSNTTQNDGVLNGKKIMWVEDDKFLSDLISRKLSGKGATLLRATNGQDALNLLTKDKPNIIVLDVMLPGMSGYEILQKIKMDPSSRDIPVIMLSNMGQREDFEKSEKLGAVKFLVKAAFTLDQILQEIRHYIK